MKTTLATFMSLAFVAVIMTAFILGSVFNALDGKNQMHTELLKNEHQLESK